MRDPKAFPNLTDPTRLDYLGPFPPAPTDERRLISMHHIPTIHNLMTPHVATLPDGARINLPAGTVLREGEDSKPSAVAVDPPWSEVAPRIRAMLAAGMAPQDVLTMVLLRQIADETPAPESFDPTPKDIADVTAALRKDR